MWRELFHEDFGDPEQIQGRSPPALCFPLTPSMNMDAAGPRAQGKAMGPEYIQPIKALKESPKPTVTCPEPAALKKLQDFKVTQCWTDVNPKVVLCQAEMDQKETWS